MSSFGVDVRKITSVAILRMSNDTVINFCTN